MDGVCNPWTGHPIPTCNRILPTSSATGSEIVDWYPATRLQDDNFMDCGNPSRTNRLFADELMPRYMSS